MGQKDHCVVIQFEAPDGTVLERSEQAHITGSLPRAITGTEGLFWLVGIKVDREHAYLPAYRLAREVSSAMH